MRFNHDWEMQLPRFIDNSYAVMLITINIVIKKKSESGAQYNGISEA